VGGSVEGGVVDVDRRGRMVVGVDEKMSRLLGRGISVL